MGMLTVRMPTMARWILVMATAGVRVELVIAIELKAGAAALQMEAASVLGAEGTAEAPSNKLSTMVLVGTDRRCNQSRRRSSARCMRMRAASSEIESSAPTVA